MKFICESFGEVNILKIWDATGTPVKIVIDGDEGGIALTASGEIIHLPSNNPEGGQQAVAEFMQYMRRIGSGPILYTPCELLEAQKLRLAKEIGGGTPTPSQSQQMTAIDATMRDEGCAGSVDVPRRP
jgi:hypothetical protein